MAKNGLELSGHTNHSPATAQTCDETGLTHASCGLSFGVGKSGNGQMETLPRDAGEGFLNSDTSGGPRLSRPCLSLA